MKIIVAIKQVPDRDAPIRIGVSGKWIDESDIDWALNESDAYALEEALLLKEKSGDPASEVIVLSAGPERVGVTLREALAKGADRAIHIVADDLASRDALGIARLLAAAIAPEKPDLILTGLQSEDLGLGQTGVILAELLALPHASLILQVEVVANGNPPSHIRAKRELEEGWFQTIELPLPALLTIQSGGNKLRYATLMGIKRAKSKEVPRHCKPPISLLALCSRRHHSRIRLPSHKQKSTQTPAPGTPAEAARRPRRKTQNGGARSMSVFVIFEHRNGKITRSSWEAAAAAATLANGAPVTAVLLGAATEALAAEAAAGPISRVLRVEHPLLATYSSDGYVLQLSISSSKRRALTHAVLPHTYQVRDFAPRLATRFGQVLISDVIAIEPGPAFVRQLFQGRMNAIYQSSGSGTCFISVQAGAFRAAPPSAQILCRHKSEIFTPQIAPSRHPHHRERAFPRHIPNR